MRTSDGRWKVGTCGSGNRRGCGGLIIWTETEKGRRMPVDSEPSAEGTFMLLEPSKYYALPAEADATPIAVHVGSKTVPTLLTAAELRAELRYTPHHATCPEVESFRR